MIHHLQAQLPPTLSPPTRLACALLAGFLLGIPTTYAASSHAPLSHLLTDTPAANGVGGTVKDAKGAGIPGVTVVVKGTKNGTVTNPDGSYRLELTTGKETLVFSSIGFKTQEVAVNGRAIVTITLIDDAAALNEVVVVGYGAQTKVNLTGSVAQVNMKAIEELPVGSLSTTLVGQLPGVGVSGGTGRPGDNGQITVRNPVILSKDGGTLRPLFVIDNIVRTEDDFNVLDQSEVESISVLKDAAAAIYGARGNQGVVLVTTKRGKAGAPKFSYSGSAGAADAVQLPSMMSGYEQAGYLNDLNFTNGVAPTSQLYYTQDELDYFKQHNFNWLKAAWKPAVVTRHALNVSGGSERATYFAGVSYNYQNANFDNINANKWTFRASTDVNITRGLRASMILSGDLAQKRMYFLKQGTENPENDMRSLLYTPQFNVPYVDGLPVLLSNSSNTNTLDAFHFFEVQKLNNYNLTRNSGFNLNASLDYELPFIKGLKVRAVYSKTMDNTFGKQYGTRYTVYQFDMLGGNKHIYGTPADGKPPRAVSLNNGDRVRLNPSYYDNYQVNGYINYDRKFGRHQVSAIAFFEQAEYHRDDLTGMKEGVVQGGYDNMNFALGTATTTESEAKTANLSYAGRLNYNFDNRYLLEASVRYDASTNFAPEYRWGIFPSVSAGWIISDESFFKNNIRPINFLKFRGSVGHLGGDATKAYQWLQSYDILLGKGAVFNNADKGIGVQPKNAIANREARWDDNIKYNAGIDMQMLGNRLSFTVDAFYDHRYNMLTALSASAPLLIGAALPSENFSTVNAYGYEISLGYGDKITADWSYRINTFLTWNDAKSVKIDVDKGKIGQWNDPVGRTTNLGIEGYRYLGMFRTDQEVKDYVDAHKGYTIFGKAPAPGMLYYQDLRGPKDANGQYTEPDGIITEVDQEYISKRQNNNYSIGFNPSMTYRGLNIQVVMGASFGAPAQVEGAARKQGTVTSNRPDFWADHWRADHTDAKYPSPAYSQSYDVNSAYWLRNGFTAGMRNATVSYTFPVQLASKVGMSSIKMFFVAVNPLNFYNPYSYKVYGGGYDNYPTIRSLSLGLNVGL
ncbi:TonB-dependent receptor [Hymenobacter sp. GOD-10R]|uniref:SusC/RagA family TonB-linked outer membrane protein n=1 Tax=Hymenobacter sp. GOD-10R TaxID=3093922 RepID=UPI002D7941D1|nr:TonB-dependent receptor [Hymenobacter sp. GOD-10R]WRQ29672.1 TonB-dependent receptor [Hymenobacter sp. GOD-10R]